MDERYDIMPDETIPDEPEPEFRCSQSECHKRSWDESDLPKCEGCGQKFCLDHLRKIDDLPFCADCRVCAACDRPAVALREGVLVCDLQDHRLGVCVCCDCEGSGEHATGEKEADTGYPVTVQCGNCGGSGVVEFTK